MQNLQKNDSLTEGLGNRCIPISEISEMGNIREAASTSSGSDCTPQDRLTTAFKESNLIESGQCSTVRQSGPCDPVKKLPIDENGRKKITSCCGGVIF